MIETEEEIWEIARRSKENLLKNNTPEMRDQIVMTATIYDCWQIWMKTFEDDEDMYKRFMNFFNDESRRA